MVFSTFLTAERCYSSTAPKKITKNAFILKISYAGSWIRYSKFCPVVTGKGLCTVATN